MLIENGRADYRAAIGVFLPIKTNQNHCQSMRPYSDMMC